MYDVGSSPTDGNFFNVRIICSSCFILDALFHTRLR